MTRSIEISEKTLNRIRDYVARESLQGRQTTVAEVVELALSTGELRVERAPLDLSRAIPVEEFRARLGQPAAVDCHDVIAARIAARGQR